MSDRLAVFNHGRIEQIGTPTAIYEHPASAFVAGFVGVSNLLDGDVARAITGSPQPFSIRPEKIRILERATRVPDGCQAADGRIESVLYLGANTRYTVALDGGGELTVIDQNRDEAGPQSARQGEAVRLVWQRAHNRVVGPAA